MLKAADPAQYMPAAGAEYPSGAFGDSMKQIAQLLKANLGVEAAFADIGGWDHHQNEGSVEWAARGSAAGVFAIAVGVLDGHGDAGGERDGGDDVGVWTHSARERHARHRSWTCECDVRDGRPGEGRPGLWTLAGAGSPEQLNEGRDLTVTTDFRQVLAEAAFKQIGARDLNLTFPGAEISLAQFLNLMA